MSDETGQSPAGHSHVAPDALERSGDAISTPSAAAALETALPDVLTAACDLFAIHGTGLMVIDDERALRYVAASDDRGRILDELQERLGTGPCVDALVHDHVIFWRDLARDERWPVLRTALLEHGIGAVIGVPVHINGVAVGSFNGYAESPCDWDDKDAQALQTYADLIGGVLAGALQARAQDRVAEQLRHALASRVLIDRAVGMLMATDGLDAVGAFSRLRDVARARRERVVELAKRVLAGEPLEPS
jgi:GAF domain-containing protein